MVFIRSIPFQDLHFESQIPEHITRKTIDFQLWPPDDGNVPGSISHFFLAWLHYNNLFFLAFPAARVVIVPDCLSSSSF